MEGAQEHDVLKWLRQAAGEGVSDIFIGAGRHITFKKSGEILPQDTENLRPEEAQRLITGLYELANRPMERFFETGDDDFPVTVPGLARFRVNTYRQRSTMAAIIRVVLFNIPNYNDLQIPEGVMKISEETRGLVLVTGPAGGGKTTTLACVIDAINNTRNCHIITLEDPIEFLHRDNKSLVSQREISTDTDSYTIALRACLRQAPDIILLGEMRDHETIKTAMTAAETGHLVISTLHTVGAANTIDRIIDIFPPEQQQQIRVQLSMVLRMVVTQKLVPNIMNKSMPVFEIMRVNNAISNLIREGKTHQIDNVIQTSAAEGMISMDGYILNLFRNGDISSETALRSAINTDMMRKQLGI
ncbi:MAG: PilT/PilU family type 4a pilus ATPase [Oscillospiraceae bacterium]|nr:PilT/PilU family type 4a pilus ATPase [Oscillospiraceae bacterium]